MLMLMMMMMTVTVMKNENKLQSGHEAPLRVPNNMIIAATITDLFTCPYI